MLLELAKSRAGQVRIRWRSTDLGAWESVDPQWCERGGRIQLRFRFQGRLLTCWAAAVRQTSCGVSLSLLDSSSSVPELFEMLWDEPDSDGADPQNLWRKTKQFLAMQFPGHRIVRAARSPDLSHTISGAFLRVLFRHGGESRLLLAAGEDSAEDIPRAVGQALFWLSTLTHDQVSGGIRRVYLLVPAGNSAVLLHRCRFLNKARIRAEIWEYANSPDAGPFLEAPAPSPPEEEKDFRWPVLGPFRWSSQLQNVLDLAPELIRRYPRFHDYDSLRLWGLEFAQVTGSERDRILFGVGPQRTELTTENFDAIRSLIEEIVFYRRPDCPDTRHPYYRLQAERWLEALILEDIPRLFPELAPESVYSQIPVYLGPDSGRIDILGADRNGTLVVMELKVTADPDLPIQALDYWGRVIQHNENGDFERRGYFSEALLSRQRPRIYLVSPVFSFHDTTELLLRYLDPEIEVWKISVNENWRSGVRIVRRSKG